MWYLLNLGNKFGAKSTLVHSPVYDCLVPSHKSGRNFFFIQNWTSPGRTLECQQPKCSVAKNAVVIIWRSLEEEGSWSIWIHVDLLSFCFFIGSAVSTWSRNQIIIKGHLSQHARGLLLCQIFFVSIQRVNNQTISHLPNIEEEKNLRRVNIAIVSFTKSRFVKLETKG